MALFLMLRSAVLLFGAAASQCDLMDLKHSLMCGDNDITSECIGMVALDASLGGGVFPLGSMLCTWPGVLCDVEGFVISISVTHTPAHSPLPSLRLLSRLERLSIVNCSVPGKVPELPPGLVELHLPDNKLTGATEVSHLQHLEDLSLDGNLLAGGLMGPLLGVLPATLKRLGLSRNRLEGDVPTTALSRFQHLQLLRLGGNPKLTGQLPFLESLQNLTIQDTGIQLLNVSQERLLNLDATAARSLHGDIDSTNFETVRASETGIEFTGSPPRQAFYGLHSKIWKETTFDSSSPGTLALQLEASIPGSIGAEIVDIMETLTTSPKRKKTHRHKAPAGADKKKNKASDSSSKGKSIVELMQRQAKERHATLFADWLNRTESRRAADDINATSNSANATINASTIRDGDSQVKADSNKSAPSSKKTDELSRKDMKTPEAKAVPRKERHDHRPSRLNRRDSHKGEEHTTLKSPSNRDEDDAAQTRPRAPINSNPRRDAEESAPTPEIQTQERNIPSEKEAASPRRHKTPKERLAELRKDKSSSPKQVPRQAKDRASDQAVSDDPKIIQEAPSAATPSIKQEPMSPRERFAALRERNKAAKSSKSELAPSLPPDQTEQERASKDHAMRSKNDLNAEDKAASPSEDTRVRRADAKARRSAEKKVKEESIAADDLNSLRKQSTRDEGEQKKMEKSRETVKEGDVLESQRDPTKETNGASQTSRMNHDKSNSNEVKKSQRRGKTPERKSSPSSSTVEGAATSHPLEASDAETQVDDLKRRMLLRLDEAKRRADRLRRHSH